MKQNSIFSLSIKQLFKVQTYIFILAFSFLETAHPAIIKEEFIFNDAPFASCHASTLTQTNRGKLLCAWFGGSEEGASDVAIWFSADIESAWSFPVKIAAAKESPCWNPVLFTFSSKEILLFYKAGNTPQEWSGFLKRSFDEGKSWSESENLPAGVIGPVRNRPLLLKDGTLLCGSSIESWRRWGCWIDITSDGGRSWRKSTPINVSSQLFGIIQPALFFTKKGTIRLVCRSHQIGAICTAESSDEGRTWTAAKATHLPNPNSAVDAINIKDGRVILIYNHSKETRYPLNIAVSQDGGESWEMKVILEQEEGEYSYPCVIQTEDGKIHVSYTWNRKKIKHVVLDPSLL